MLGVAGQRTARCRIGSLWTWWACGLVWWNGTTKGICKYRWPLPALECGFGLVSFAANTYTRIDFTCVKLKQLHALSLFLLPFDIAEYLIPSTHKTPKSLHALSNSIHSQELICYDVPTPISSNEAGLNYSNAMVQPGTKYPGFPTGMSTREEQR